MVVFEVRDSLTKETNGGSPGRFKSKDVGNTPGGGGSGGHGGFFRRISLLWRN